MVSGAMTKRSFEETMRAAGAAVAKVRRGYQPSPTAATRIVVSLDAIELGALDIWITDQPDPKPSREDAMRLLLAEALIRK
jgi:hypothetical protein